MKRYILSLFAIFALSTLAFGQSETGQISGTVTDVNGAVVPNANVMAKSVTTGFSRSTTTNSDGYYALVNLQPSKYEITIKATNFEEYKTTRELGVASNIQIDAKLAITGQKAVVDVVGSSITEINTSDQSISGTVTSSQLQELPTINRDPYGFVTTLGNVSEADPSGRGVGVSVNGQRSASTSILINGGENVDNFRATAGQSIPIDSVQEFKVTTGTFTAEFGRASGGVVNLVTKSGQNSFFGSGYLFNRNSKLSSAGFDSNARNIGREFFNRNQYGFSIGGPVIKNKLLFFNNTEWLKIRSNGVQNVWVPTAASIAGANVRTQSFFNAYSLSATPTGRTGSIAGTGTNVLNLREVQYTVPADTGAGLPVDGLNTVSRIDWNPSSRFQLFGALAFEDRSNALGSVGRSPYQGFSTGNTDRNINFTASGTYNFSSNLIGVTRFTYNNLENQQPLGDQPAGPTLYLRSTAVAVGGTAVALPGYLPLSPGSAIPFGGPQKMYTGSQEVTWIKGDHILKGGFSYYYQQDNRTFGAFQNSVQILGSNNVQAVDNFFAGVLFQFQGAINPNGRFPGQTITLPVSAPQFSRDNRYKEYSFYAQDSFKLFPGFTAILGVRYENYGPQRSADPSLDFNFYFGSGNSLAQRIRNGSVQNASASPVGDLWQEDNNNWAPSVGFAYDIEGNGKSSLRAGYALRYERNFGNVTFNVIQNPSAYGVVSITSADLGGTPIGITTNNAGPLAGSTGSVTLPRVSLRHVREDIVNAYSHQWSGSYERRFGNDLLLSATYSGTSGKSLYTLENINRAGSGTTYLGSLATCPGLAPVDRLSCQYSNINTRANNGYSTYHGLTFSALSDNLFGKGLSLASYYTFAKAKDNLSSTFSESGNNFNLGLLDPFNPALDFGNADFDVRHRWVTSYTYKLPLGNKLDGIAKTLLGGWVTSGIFKMQSGSPFTVFDCADATATVCKRLVATGNLLTRPTSAATANADPNSFNFLPLTGQNVVLVSNVENGGPFPASMTARNAFRGPGRWDFDVNFSKTFAFTEKVKMTLRLDANNIFNHANLFINGGEADISSTNVITGFKDGRRQIAAGVRFSF